ncbi:uncharacterized protein LOC132066745 isoform X2 [Lycium ferocissimum]|uniref:uncharacterized protein LOC132066745 isoform X2 n=1 Tax=Lycium ferocissimum TaxID=112874 RepID=UPI002815FE41|nr:uncharacterized protein LOC132066745 isoform X2 [Lycium ferocissimum]
MLIPGRHILVGSGRNSGQDSVLLPEGYNATVNKMSVMKLIKFNWILHSGMWGTFNKLHSGFRAYQTAKNSEAADSRCAMMARSTKKISSDEGAGTLERVSGEEDKCENVDIQSQRGAIASTGNGWLPEELWLSICKGHAKLLCIVLILADVKGQE